MVRELMIGSSTDFNDSLVSVKSVAGDMAMPPAGSGRLRCLSANSVASVKLPPAESPAINAAAAGEGPVGPLPNIQLYVVMQSSSPAGKGCSGDKR